MTGPSSMNEGSNMNEGFDMDALLQQAKAMHDQLATAQAAAAAQVVEGQAGGGVVKVRVTGDMDFQSVSIDPQAVDPEDASMLEDLVLAACNDAVARARSLGQQALGGLDLGGLGLGGAGLGGIEPGTPGPPRPGPQ